MVVNRENFDNWQTWLLALTRAQMLLKRNYPLLTGFEDQFKSIETDFQSKQRCLDIRETLISYIDSISSRIKSYIDFAIEETTQKSTDLCPYFQSPLSSLIWYTASKRQNSGLLLYDLFPDLGLNVKSTEDTELSEDAGFDNSEWFEMDAMESGNQYTDWELNEMDIVKATKHENYTLQEQLITTQLDLKAAKNTIAKLQQALSLRERRLQDYESRLKQTQSDMREKLKIMKNNRDDLLLGKNPLFNSDNASKTYENPIDSDFGQPPIEPPDFIVPAVPKQTRIANPAKPCFLQFYHLRKAEIRSEKPDISGLELSEIIGQEWGRMTKEEKVKYREAQMNMREARKKQFQEASFE